MGEFVTAMSETSSTEGTAEGLGDSVPYAASATVSIIMVSNSTGVSFRACQSVCVWGGHVWWL